MDLSTTEQELQVLGCQLVHGNLVIVDGAADHIGFLLLQKNHARLDRVFDAKSSDDARTRLANAMASIGRLPFSGGVPPSK